MIMIFLCYDFVLRIWFKADHRREDHFYLSFHVDLYWWSLFSQAVLRPYGNFLGDSCWSHQTFHPCLPYLLRLNIRGVLYLACMLLRRNLPSHRGQRLPAFLRPRVSCAYSQQFAISSIHGLWAISFALYPLAPFPFQLYELAPLPRLTS